MRHQTEKDEAEKFAENGMLELLRLAFAFGCLYFGGWLLHWVVGTSVPPLKSLALGFAVFALIVWFWRINESEFMELRSRAKEMNSKLDDVSAKLDDLMERLEEKGEEQMGEQISDVVERLDRIEHEQGRLHEHLQEFGSKLAQ